jgi:hypothetical protein
MDAERTCLVRGGGDNLARAAWVAVAADHHWETGQLGSAAYLDSGQELVEVDMEHPVVVRCRVRCCDRSTVSLRV